jgi:hypothetical protein
MKTPVLPEWLRPPASWKVWESPHSQAAEKRGLSPGTLIADPEGGADPCAADPPMAQTTSRKSPSRTGNNPPLPRNLYRSRGWT